MGPRNKVKQSPRTFGTNLELFREARGLSVIRISKLMGIARSTYYRYREGRKDPRHSEIVRICRRLKCDAQEMFGDPEHMAIRSKEKRIVMQRLNQFDNIAMKQVLQATKFIMREQQEEREAEQW